MNLREYIEHILTQFDENVECTCFNYDDDGCFYRMTNSDQDYERLNYLMVALEVRKREMEE